MESYFVVIVIIGILASHKLLSLKRSVDQKISRLIEEKRKLEQETSQLTDEKIKLNNKRVMENNEYQARILHLSTLRHEFDADYIDGRQWLAKFISEAEKAFDESISLTLR